MNPHDRFPQDDGIDTAWAGQERLRKAVAAGETVPEADRALYSALSRMPLPPLPEDFATQTAMLARRSAQARQGIARLRGMLLRLFGLLYLPAMLFAALTFAADLPMAWLRAEPAQRLPLQWGLVVVVLAAASAFTARRRSRAAIE